MLIVQAMIGGIKLETTKFFTKDLIVSIFQMVHSLRRLGGFIYKTA